MHLSLHTLSEQIRTTIRRFPVASALAFLWTALLIYRVELLQPYSVETYPDLLKVLFVCALGFPLLLAATIIGEQRKWTSVQRMLAAFLCLAFLAIYFFMLPANGFDGAGYHTIRFALFFICFCLAIIVGPFLKKGGDNDYWSFNRRLAQSFAISFIFAGTLFAGLSASVGSIAYLFETYVPERFYGELWVLMTGIVATHIFLAGVPKAFEVEKDEAWYPTIVRVFSQYILLPLVALYTFILSVYSVKILLTGVWPKGQVCYMVLGYAAAGILTDILLFPSRSDKKFRWVKIVSTVYYAMLALFSLLLYGAIWQRIEQYGLTENRYFVVLLGTWSLCMALYFLFRKEHNIRLIPISLSALLILSSFGPWSAFNLSKQYQYHRLEAALKPYDLLENGMIVSGKTDELTFEDRETISGVIDYLYETHGMKSLQPYFSFDLDALYTKAKLDADFYRSRFPEVLMKEVGITHRYQWNRSDIETFETGEKRETFHYSLNELHAVDVSGYRFFNPIERMEHSQRVLFSVDAQTHNLIDLDYSYATDIRVTSGAVAVANFDLREHFKKLHPNYDRSNISIPVQDMLLKDGDWGLLLQSVTYSLKDGNIDGVDFTGWLLRR